MRGYTLIYRGRGPGRHTWIHRFSHYNDYKGLDVRRAMSHSGGSWERTAETVQSWFRTFRPLLRWAVALDPTGRVILDWRRLKNDPVEIP